MLTAAIVSKFNSEILIQKKWLGMEIGIFEEARSNPDKKSYVLRQNQTRLPLLGS